MCGHYLGQVSRAHGNTAGPAWCERWVCVLCVHAGAVCACMCMCVLCAACGRGLSLGGVSWGKPWSIVPVPLRDRGASLWSLQGLRLQGGCEAVWLVEGRGQSHGPWRVHVLQDRDHQSIPGPRGLCLGHGSVCLSPSPALLRAGLRQQQDRDPLEDKGVQLPPAPQDSPPSCFGAHTRGCGDLLRGQPPWGQL